ncbi:MAG: FecR domain-containing protein [Candidatus Riflebacteria bacterium]|nr:FecR domain-containing protein [Candidatus Riflebacteria bacterium]
MMKRWFVVFLLVFCSLGIAWAEDSGARFSSISGQVDLRPDAGAADAWKSAKMESMLNVDDHVKTGEDSSAIIGFADMSTFLLKNESEIVINTPPTKDSKVHLLSGKIWVNVKKMVKDGEMSVEMSQAVAGIKGTNITCSTSLTEDRIQVLRGIAEVLIKESQEHVSLKEGEELIVKSGGKTEKLEINIQQESDKWKKELSKLGDSIQLNDLPDSIRSIMDNEDRTFKGIQTQHGTLLSANILTDDQIYSFRKDAERFVGVLMEDSVILSSLQLKVDQAIAAGTDPTTAAGYQKQIAESRKIQQNYQTQLVSMSRLSASKNAPSPETDQIRTETAATWETIDGLTRQLQGNPNGMSQDWFADALSQSNDALKRLGEQATRVQAVLDANPTDAAALGLMKQIGGYQTQINTFMRSLNVVTIEAAELTEMDQVEFTLSDSILKLRGLISQYNTTFQGTTKAQDESRLRATLQILNDYGRAKRSYLSAQRRYQAIMQSASGQKYQTAEQTEFKEIFDRISNTFQQLGVAADELSTRLQDLEGQLGHYLK